MSVKITYSEELKQRAYSEALARGVPLEDIMLVRTNFGRDLEVVTGIRTVPLGTPIAKKATCEGCGAPHEPAELACTYCGRPR